MELLIKFVPAFVVLIISITIHEFAHCWATDRLGDDTPRRMGRITLNPLAHLDPWGTVMMVVSSLSGFGFGWGKPAVFDPLNFRHPARDRMLTAIAGPLSNVLQLLAWAALGAITTPLLYDTAGGELAAKLCIYGVTINAILAGFNMLPIYPLDGHHVLSYLLPYTLRPIVDNPLWMYAFLAVMFIPALRDTLLTPVMHVVLKTGMLLAAYLVGWPLSPGVGV